MTNSTRQGDGSGTPSAKTLQGALRAGNSTRSSLCAEVATRLGIPETRSLAVLNALLRAVVAGLSQGRPVQVRGFGTWSLRHRKGHVGRNPRTNEVVMVPPHVSVRFQPHKEMNL